MFLFFGLGLGSSDDVYILPLFITSCTLVTQVDSRRGARAMSPPNPVPKRHPPPCATSDLPSDPTHTRIAPFKLPLDFTLHVGSHCRPFLCAQCPSTLPCVRAHKQLFMHKKLKCKEYLAYPLPPLSSARPCGRFAGNDKALKMSWHKFWSAARTRGYNEAVTNCVKQLKGDSRAAS